jgi:hypothetical protein
LVSAVSNDSLLLLLAVIERVLLAKVLEDGNDDQPEKEPARGLLKAEFELNCLGLVLSGVVLAGGRLLNGEVEKQFDFY